MDKHAVSASRVVNIDETSRRILPVHQIGWGRRGVNEAQLHGNTREATTYTVAFSMDRGPLDMLARISDATLGAMRTAFPHIVLCFLPPRSTSYLQPCDVAVFRSFKSCASATLARSVLDGSFEGLAMNKACRRMGTLRSAGPLRQKPGVPDWLASLARPQRCPLQRRHRRSRGAPCRL